MSVELKLDPGDPAPSKGLFFDPAHARLTYPPALHVEAWDGDFLASIVVAEREAGHWISPPAATFGGYMFDRGKIREFRRVNEAVVSELRRRGGTSLEIWLPPLAHDESALSLLAYEMLSAGFTLQRSDLSYVRRPGPEFTSVIAKGKAQRLVKLKRDGYAASSVGPARLAEVYEVIAANRVAKGYPLSMSMAQVEALAARFPDHVRLFAVMRDDVMIASALCLVLDHATMQVVYWGERPEYMKMSPIIALAEAIDEAARAMKLSMLDAGTSTIGEDANRGLMQFKTELGFQPSLKFRLRADFG